MAAFLVVLGALHALEPEYDVGHLISEYQLGPFGALMSIAFCCLGGALCAIAIAVSAELASTGMLWRRAPLLVIGAAAITAGLFPPVREPRFFGLVHGISGLTVIFGAPIAFSLVHRALAQGEHRNVQVLQLRRATGTVWAALVAFGIATIAFALAPPASRSTALELAVSVTNRLVIVSHCVWIATVGRRVLGAAE